MNYQKIYDNLVAKRQLQPALKQEGTYGSVEWHHIIPRCIGGSDDKSNLVCFYPREHYIAHLLLWKIHPKHFNLMLALCSMAGNVNATNMRQFKYNSRLYEKVKLDYSMALKEYYKTHDGTIKGKKLAFDTKTQSLTYVDKNAELPDYIVEASYRWIHNDKTNEEREICYILPLPEGWSEGRLKNLGVSYTGQMMISNPTTKQIKYVDKDTPIPKGWKKGSCNKKCRSKETKARLKQQQVDKANLLLSWLKDCNLSFDLLRQQHPDVDSTYKRNGYILQLFNRNIEGFDWKTLKAGYQT